MAEKTASEVEFPISASSNEELAVALKGSAILSNKFIATNTNAGVRISFCETIGASPQDLVFRSAVVLSYPDAVALRDLLNFQLKSIAFLEVPPEAKTQEG